MNEGQTSNRDFPKYPEPFWRDSIELPAFEPLGEDIQADVAIVGGGITGITAGYLLQKEGFEVVILEASEILNGTTGHTTAKVTAQHGLIYDELIGHFGAEKAKLYYEANLEAMKFIENIVKEHKVECDFSKEDAFVYATTDQKVASIDKEFNAYRKLGIRGDITEEIPFDLEIKKAIVMKDQAQFHPLKYLEFLLKDFLDRGGQVFEHTVAVDIEDAYNPVILTKNGKRVTCKYAISCSHFPFIDRHGMYFARMYSERAYALGIKARKPYPGGMYINAEDPSRSLRYANMNGEPLVLIIGENHKTGHGVNMMKHYEQLRAFGEQVMGIEQIMYRWSTEDLTTLDKVPYIGHITSSNRNTFIATGYRKWGMTNGTVAGLILRDLILNRDNPYKDVFTPGRFTADPDVKKFVRINTDVAGHFIAGKVGMAYKRAEDLKHDEGAVVQVNGKRAGAYKDEHGELHMVDTTCSHMGCELEWNDAERTWDCPCHGSRFSYDGEVIEGPAKHGLKQIYEKKHSEV